MQGTIPTRGVDGCYHPSTEDEIRALVRHARATKKKLRVLGSSHSVWRAIVTDRFDGPNTPDDELQLVLDRYNAIDPLVDDPSSPGQKLVTVQAGCHLGLSPKRPVESRIEPHTSAAHACVASSWHENGWETSLTYVLQQQGFAFDDLGGITHQTVAGFLSTGSSGGSTKWSVHDAIVELRIIDGNGDVHTLRADGPTADYFAAAGIAMGLVGVISTVTLRCVPTFDILGTETISEVRQSDVVDFYGDRPASVLPSLERFLLETDYTRLMWWPQRGFDRLVVWKAARAPYDPDRKIRPYREIAHLPVLSQVAASLVYTILGNLEMPERIESHVRSVREHPALAGGMATLLASLRARLPSPPIDPALPEEPQHLFPYVSALVEMLRGERHDPITLGAAFVRVVELLVCVSDATLASLLSRPFFRMLSEPLARLVPEHIDTVLGLFVTTGKGGAPATQHFADRAFLGLPMDNQMDDLLMPTWFTEIFIPFTPGDGTVARVVDTLRTHFDSDGTAEGCYRATGPFCFELYAAKADHRFMLSAAHGRPVFRVDVFWFGMNRGNPVHDFYPQFWNLLEPFEYRLHWGKFLPDPASVPPARLLSRFPRFDDWKAIRRTADPGDVFLTSYWRRQLGLDDQTA